MTTAITDFLVGFDLETTGLSIQHDRIITAALTDAEDRRFHLLLNPERKISAKTTEITGLTDADVVDGMDYREGVTHISDLLASAWDHGATVVGHNILGFDLPMIRMQERYVFGHPRTNTIGPTLDTMKLYRKARLSTKYTLGLACETLGIVLDNAHDALADAEASIALARKLLGMGVTY